MRKVLIASVLKPVTDPRMFGKIGKSLAESNGFEVHLAGYYAQLPAAKKVNFYPLFKFKRLSFQRLLAPVRILWLAWQLKPEVFIVSTHELLWIACFYKFLFNAKIFYDVQENYYRNILYMKTFPPFIRVALALMVRLKEKTVAPLFDGFILAERVYEHQLQFLRGKLFIAENLFQPSENTSIQAGISKNRGWKFLYTGTIAEEYGVFEAIHVVKKIHEVEKDATLLIIGFSSDASILEKIIDQSKGFSFIQLKIKNSPISHDLILWELQRADFLLMPYRKNKATEGKIPTKLFEALYLKVPFISTKGISFQEFVKPYNAGLFVDIKSVEPIALLSQLKQPFFSVPVSEQNFLWEPVGKDLVKWIQSKKI